MRHTIRKNRQILKELFDTIAASHMTGQALILEEALENTVNLIIEKASVGGKIMFIGNGGSAAIASHMATDFWKNGGIKATAFNDSVLLTCISNDHGYKHVFEKSIEMFAHPDDVLVAISSSGQSEYILRGGAAAQAAYIAVITLSGFKADNPLRSKGDANFYVPSSHYGHVEVLHHSLCHCWIDTIMENKAKPKEVSKFL